MKTLTTIILGSALTLGMAFAAQPPADPNQKPATAKKHKKQNKIRMKKVAPAATAQATAPSK